MAARRKSPKRKAAPKKKAAAKRTGAKRRSTTPRELPNDAAWRELVETAIEKAEPGNSGKTARRRSK